jgi:hypothetical protein
VSQNSKAKPEEAPINEIIDKMTKQIQELTSLLLYAR